VIPPPPPTVFYLSNTDKIRLLAVLQTERDFFWSCYDRAKKKVSQDIYFAKLTQIQEQITSLLTYLNQ